MGLRTEMSWLMETFGLSRLVTVRVTMLLGVGTTAGAV